MLTRLVVLSLSVGLVTACHVLFSRHVRVKEAGDARTVLVDLLGCFGFRTCTGVVSVVLLVVSVVLLVVLIELDVVLAVLARQAPRAASRG